MYRLVFINSEEKEIEIPSHFSQQVQLKVENDKNGKGQTVLCLPNIDHERIVLNKSQTKNIISDLHDLLNNEYWKYSFDRITKNSIDICRELFGEIIPSMEAFQDESRAFSFLADSISEKNLQEHERRATGIFTSLVRRAYEIQNHKFVYIFTDDSSIDEHAAQSFSEYVDYYLEHIFGKSLELNIAFASFSKNNADNTAYRKFIKSLFLHNTLLGNKDEAIAKLRSKGPTLLLGPTGTGKTFLVDLFTEKIQKKCIKLNISTVSADLIEGRLLGTEKGFATGVEKRDGYLKMANEGTLFLDEFQDCPVHAQKQLLTIINPISNFINYRTLGGLEDLECEEKIIVAYNRELDDKSLREDLLFRIRNIVEFRDLNDFFKGSDESVRIFLNKLFTTYRWQSNEIQKKIMEKKSENMNLFVCLDNAPELYDYFKSLNWSGNLRQLSKLAFEVLESIDSKYDQQTFETINIDTIKIEIEKNMFFYKDTVRNINSEKVNDVLVQLIEQALKETSVNFTKTCDILKPIIASESTLYKKIKLYYQMFSEEIKNHPKILSKILEIEKKECSL